VVLKYPVDQYTSMQTGIDINFKFSPELNPLGDFSNHNKIKQDHQKSILTSGPKEKLIPHKRKSICGSDDKPSK
jgi:hypothetical protein